MKERTKGFLSGILLMVAVFSMIGTAAASTANVKQTLEYNNIGVEVNGKKVSLQDASGNSVEPFMINGTNYLPVRAVSEVLGANVSWNSANKTIQIVNLSKKIGQANTEKMNFYYKIASELSNLMFVESSIVSSPSIFQSNSLNSKTEQTMNNNLSIYTALYESVKADGLITASDAEMFTSYTQIEKQTIDHLELFRNTATSSQIQQMQKEAYQNSSSILSLQTEINSAEHAQYVEYLNSLA